MKYLLWIGVIVVILLGLRMLNLAKAKRRADAAGRGPSAAPLAETMIRCSRCGVYVPQKDATPGPAGPTCGEPACLRPS